MQQHEVERLKISGLAIWTMPASPMSQIDFGSDRSARWPEAGVPSVWLNHGRLGFYRVRSSAISSPFSTKDPKNLKKMDFFGLVKKNGFFWSRGHVCDTPPNHQIPVNHSNCHGFRPGGVITLPILESTVTLNFES
jgi:hypothetical protein